MSLKVFQSLALAASFTTLLTSPFTLAQAPERKAPSVVLVELFTSEGCSDCPAADNLLRKINGQQTASGQLIVGISEHVTYWNHLGWTDPFSASIYTDRQNSYGTAFSLPDIYTPQMVVNGEKQFVGSDSSSLARALDSQLQHPSIDLHIQSTQVSNGSMKVAFSAKAIPAHQTLDIIAVLTDDSATSKVIHGENGGHTLQHAAVARSLVKVATLRSDSEMTVQISLPHSSTNTTHHLVLFAQKAGMGPIVGADALPLAPNFSR